MAEAPGGAAPQPRLPAGWQLDLHRTLSYIVPLLSAELRITFMEFVKSLKAKRDALQIPSLSAALMERAMGPLVGADLWQQCIDRQREEAAQQAEAPAGRTDGAAPQRKRTADAAELASPREEHTQQIAEEFICPISQELPVKPVIAEDGRIYEEDHILKWFAMKREAKSPTTGAVIGTKLIAAPQIRNTIEKLVKSGAIKGELAEAWQKASAKNLAIETRVKELRVKADAGDGEAMYELGIWYQCNSIRAGIQHSKDPSLTEDTVQARAWFERSAAARNPKGLAVFGAYLVTGIGGPQDNVFGVMNLTQAAELGSQVGAHSLGKAFLNGDHGLPKDPARARYWLNREEDCRAASRAARSAAELLRELDGAPAEAAGRLVGELFGSLIAD